MGAKGQFRRDLAQRLQARHADIEQAILTRVYSVDDPTAVGDPEYVSGLQAAVATAVDYGLAGLEERVDASAPIPAQLLDQARHAARSGVPLETVLRRYVAGHTLLADFILQEAERGKQVPSSEIQALGRTQAATLDRLVDAVAAEYRAESEMRSRTSEERRRDTIKKLLDGELVETDHLGYPFGSWHVGLVATGPSSIDLLRCVGGEVGGSTLTASQREGASWAWIGSQRQTEVDGVARVAHAATTPGQHVAIGEAAEGLAGWRLTHQQAVSALPVAVRGGEPLARYADVGLLASILRDDVLVQSLRDLYLEPLARERDQGFILRKTLRAYLLAGRNASSAAAALQVSRNTVNARLRSVEEHIGRPLSRCAAELELTLRLDQLGAYRQPGRPSS